MTAEAVSESEWVWFNVPPDTVYRSFRGRPFQAVHIHVKQKV